MNMKQNRRESKTKRIARQSSEKKKQQQPGWAQWPRQQLQLHQHISARTSTTNEWMEITKKRQWWIRIEKSRKDAASTTKSGMQGGQQKQNQINRTKVSNTTKLEATWESTKHNLLVNLVFHTRDKLRPCNSLPRGEKLGHMSMMSFTSRDSLCFPHLPEKWATVTNCDRIFMLSKALFEEVWMQDGKNAWMESTWCPEWQ